MYFMKRETDLEPRKRELTALMLAPISNEALMESYSILRNEIIVRGLAQETVQEAFKKMDYEELKSAVNAGLNEVWHRGETTDSIKDVPEYMEVPDGVVDPFEWRERELAKLSETLEANQKAFSDNQFEEEKAKLVTFITKMLKESNITKVIKDVKDTCGKRAKFTIAVKAIINGKVTDKILDENKVNLFSVAVSESIELCFDAFEESEKIGYPLDGVFCEIGCCIEENGKITLSSGLYDFAITKKDLEDSNFTCTVGLIR